MPYDPKDPVDDIFTEIEDLADISSIANSPLSDRQKIDFAYLLLQRTRHFKLGLQEWNRKSTSDQTWINFMIHFRDVHQDLKKTGELTVQEGINHADLINMVSEGVKNALEQAPEQPPEESINITTETDSLKQQLAEMQIIIKDLQTTKQNSIQPQPTYYQHPNHLPRQYQPFQDMTNHYNNHPYANGYYPRGNKHIKTRKPRQYCWTHGLSAHESSTCYTKMQGHQDKATLANRMGGSARNCKA